MAEFEFISFSDLNESMRLVAQELVAEERYNILPPLQQIKTMCLLFQKFSPIESNTAEMRKEIYALGAKIIFSLRSFLLQSEILFTVGAMSPDGTQLSTTTYTQDQVLNNLKVNLTNSQIELSSTLEAFNNEKLDTYSSLWPQIVNATEYTWNSNIKYETRKYITSKNKARFIYRKPFADTNVWFRYYQRQKVRLLTYYYDKGGFDLVAYNKGWLYEWFQEYIQDPDNAEQLRNAFDSHSNTPLSGMMSEVQRENIPGYKGGDYQQANGKWAQAKYGNRRIITFTSIKTVISNVLKYITQFEAQSDYSKEQLAKDLTNTFTDRRTINDSYDKITNTILSSLKLT